MAATCHYCDRAAEYLCDFVLDVRTGGTCDRSLCEAHRVQVGTTFFCDRTRRRHGCQVDSRDLCPGHAGVPDGYQPPFQPVRNGGRGSAA